MNQHTEYSDGSQRESLRERREQYENITDKGNDEGYAWCIYQGWNSSFRFVALYVDTSNLYRCAQIFFI